MIHAVIPTKYQKYPSTTILIHVNFLAKGYKSPCGRLPNIMPHDVYSITIHVRTIVADISNRKRTKLLL